jgi:hypothetical protein
VSGLFPVEVEDRDRAAVVVRKRMIEKRDEIAGRRHAWKRHVAGRLVEHLAERELDPSFSLDVPGDDHRFSVGGEIHLEHPLLDLARRAPEKKSERQRSLCDAVVRVAAIHRDRDLSCARDG